MTAVVDRIGELRLLDWPDGAAAPALDALGPAGLGPEAIVAIRRLALQADPARVADAVRAEVTASVMRAHRPRDGYLDPAAEVVLFRDRAEMFACFVVGLLDRTARPDWWWAELAPLLPPSRLASVVAHAGPDLAHVLWRLDDWGRLAAVACALDEPAAVAVLDTLATNHGLRWGFDAGPAPSVTGQTGAKPSLGPERVNGVAVWRPDATTPVLRLRRGSWDGQDLRRLVTVATGGADPAPDRRGGASAVEGAAGTLAPPEAATEAEPESISGAEPWSGPGRPAAVVPDGDDATRTAPARERRPRPALARIVPVGAAAHVGSPSDDSPRHRSASDPPAVSPAATSAAEPGRVLPPGVASAVAGALYLINPLRRLELPRFGLAQAAPWDLVEALGREAAGVERDPLWDVLAALAGRPGGAGPAAEVQRAAPAVLAHIADWLDFGSDSLSWAQVVTVGGRVVWEGPHLDVVFPLDAVDVRVRRRGLDLDPGWVPSLGRVLRFHYGEVPW